LIRDNCEYYVLEENNKRLGLTMYYTEKFLFSNNVLDAKRYEDLQSAQFDAEKNDLNFAVPKKVKAAFQISTVKGSANARPRKNLFHSL
jgi:hypothetical protein